MKKRKRPNLVRSTVENFKNASELIDPNKPVVLIISNYHMQRALKDAKNTGFKYVFRIPVKTYGSNLMWEAAAELKSITP